jgi:ABC-type transport system involved in multi-copper enzyme maturation permease subunit
MWWKSWSECRTRVLLAGICWLFISGVVLLILSTIGHGKNPQDFLNLYWAGLACGVTPIMTLLMAGSGINSQTSWGMLRGFHGSMYFLLSLPVSRAKALFVRAAVGAIFTLLFVVFSVLTIGLLAPATGVKIPLQSLLVRIPFMLTGAFGSYGLSTFLTMWLDEYWAGTLGMGLMGMAFGAEMTVWKSAVHFNPAQVLSGEQFLKTGAIEWPVLALMIVMGVLFLAVSAWGVERKEY